MPEGTVKWFNSEKGYGFITSANDEDIFAHQSEIMDVDSLIEGLKVAFDVVSEPKGLKAINIKVICTEINNKFEHKILEPINENSNLILDSDISKLKTPIDQDIKHKLINKKKNNLFPKLSFKRIKQNDAASLNKNSCICYGLFDQSFFSKKRRCLWVKNTNIDYLPSFSILLKKNFIPIDKNDRNAILFYESNGLNKKSFSIKIPTKFDGYYVKVFINQEDNETIKLFHPNNTNVLVGSIKNEIVKDENENICLFCYKKIPLKVSQCPHCGKNIHPLYKDILNKKIICIDGNTNSGKTVFLSILINSLLGRIGKDELGNHGYHMRLIGDEAKETFEEHFSNILSELPQSTSSIKGTSSSGVPLTCALDKNNENSKVVVFYDSAGELTEYENKISDKTYMLNSNAIIYFIDLENNEKIFSTLTNLNNFINVFQSIKSSNELKNKIDKPIFFVFSKCDKYITELEAFNKIFKNNFDEISLSDLQTISNEFESFIQTFFNKYPALSKLLRRMKDAFSSYNLIPISSLGYMPVDAKDINENKLSPYMTTYPFLYFVLNNNI